MAAESEEKKMKKSKRKADRFSTEGSPSKRRREKSLEPQDSTIPRISQSKQDSANGISGQKEPLKTGPDKNKLGEDEEATKDDRVRGILLKYQKAIKRAPKKVDVDINPVAEVKEDAHGIVPLPQPEQLEDGPYRPDFSTLPKSFQAPLITPASRTTSFKDLPISPELVSVLNSKGFKDAFAVQAAVLPLLLPGDQRHNGDVCVSASTGSGKTLAYVLPMVDSMRDRALPALRGLIVVPTRELAVQVADVCRMCASGTKLNIEIALGNRPLRVERDVLVERSERCDPVAYRELWQNEAERLDQEMWENFEDFRHTYLKQDAVYDYHSKVDILICTPGRLVEHLKTTRGFSLAHLEWLIVDEADRLLDQNFQGWLSTISKQLKIDLDSETGDAATKISRSLGISVTPRQVRKVVLSATLTRDTGKITSLDLKNAKLVVVSDDGTVDEHSSLNMLDDLENTGLGERENIYNLPALLYEQAVPVGDGGFKPLYLLNILRQYIFLGTVVTHKMEFMKSSDTDMSSDSSTESDTDSDTDSSSETNSDSSSTSLESTSSASDSDSDSDTDTDTESESSSESASVADVEMQDAPTIQVNKPEEMPTVLIFTRSNESTLRLSRLLELLDSKYSSRIGVLTSSVRRSQRKKTLAQFLRGDLSILIASDLVSRGLDLPKLSHVINYDPPTSVTEYVHRCGRTARAGKSGTAFTLLADREARWFWNNIARGEEIRRPNGAKVVRLKVELDQNTEVDALETALKALETEVKSR